MSLSERDLHHLICKQMEIISYFEGMTRGRSVHGIEGDNVDFKYLEKMRSVKDILVQVYEENNNVKDNTSNT